MIDSLASAASLFGGLQPKDLITIGLAVAALVVSIVAITQKRTYHPRPEWDGSLLPSPPKRAEEMGRPYIAFELQNIGTDDAVKPRFRLRAPQLDDRWIQLSEVVGTRNFEGDRMRPDAHLRFEIGTVYGDLRTQSVDGLKLSPEGEAVPGLYVVEVEWRQGPNVNRVRRKRWKHRLG